MPGFPSPIFILSISTTGPTNVVAEETKASEAFLASSIVKGLSSILIWASLAYFKIDNLVTPARILFERFLVTKTFCFVII